MSRNINLGGSILKLEVRGADEALEKVNLLTQKLAEAKSLISEIASMELDINFSSEDDKTSD